MSAAIHLVAIQLKGKELAGDRPWTKPQTVDIEPTHKSILNQCVPSTAGLGLATRILQPQAKPTHTGIPSIPMLEQPEKNVLTPTFVKTGLTFILCLYITASKIYVEKIDNFTHLNRPNRL